MKAPEISDADKLKAAIEVRKNTIKINIVDLWKRVQVRMDKYFVSIIHYARAHQWHRMMFQYGSALERIAHRTTYKMFDHAHF